MRIVISGLAEVKRSADDTPVSDPAVLTKLDGYVCEEDTVIRYLDGPLDRIGLIDGFLRLRYNAEQSGMLIVTEYGSPRELKPKELKVLTSETVAQWSDGIGEGGWTSFDDLGVWVDLFPHGQAETLTVTQFDDGIKVAPPKKPPMLSAASSGNLKRIQKLIDEGENLSPVDKDGFDPIQLALYNGHVEAARMLIEAGADLSHRKVEEFSPITTAVIKGHAEIVRLMLEKGADVNGRMPSGETAKYFPLLMACNRHQLEVGKVLLEYGADVNQRDPSGYTPMMMLGPDDVELGRLLLERGADPKASNDFGGVDKKLLNKLGVD